MKFMYLRQPPCSVQGNAGLMCCRDAPFKIPKDKLKTDDDSKQLALVPNEVEPTGGARPAVTVLPRKSSLKSFNSPKRAQSKVRLKMEHNEIAYYDKYASPERSILGRVGGA